MKHNILMFSFEEACFASGVLNVVTVTDFQILELITLHQSSNKVRVWLSQTLFVPIIHHLLVFFPNEN
jgi:hypothetical protein